MARQSEPSSPAGQAITVLVTRPRDQAEAFARSLTARFGARVIPVVAPLMAPKYLSPPVPPGPFSAVIFTSAHGVQAAMRLQADLPRLAFCVGRATAAAAVKAGFEARSSDGDVAGLVADLIRTAPSGQMLYLRGVDTIGDLENALINNAISVLSLQVYLQIAVPLEGESLTLLRQPGPVVVPLFSPRSARLFRAALPSDAQASLRIAALSAAIAEAAAEIPRRALSIASRPDADAMLDAVESLLVPTPLP